MRPRHVESRESTAIVRIDRPPANAMNPELVEEIIAAAAELAASAPDAVVIIGRDGFFSAGLDLNLVPTLDAAGQAEMIMAINRMVAAWYGFPRPVVGAINGHAIAGGIVLALCADYRVGSTQGKLGLTETRVGVPYPANALAVVQAELSPPAARYLVLRAHLVEPPEALELGMVDELADPPTCWTGRSRWPPSWATCPPTPTRRSSASCAARCSRRCSEWSSRAPTRWPRAGCRPRSAERAEAQRAPAPVLRTSD